MLVHEPYVAEVIARECEFIPAELRANTTVLVTCVHNALWMFYGRF